MYHHHLLTMDKNETIYKIYQTQKEDLIKGDWIQLWRADFNLIKQEMNKHEISLTPKSVYRKRIKQLLNKPLFKHLLELKNGHSKLVDITYYKFQIQPYLTSK